MKHDPIDTTRFFFATAPMPCPYLPGRMERRLVTELVGRDAAQLHNALSLAGFRRSHDIAYTPACPGCTACVAVRIVADGFRLSPSLRRIKKLNARVSAEEAPPTATGEQFTLFSVYQDSRHGDGDMARMDFDDYRMLVEDTPLDTALIEFRDLGETLVAALLIDRIEDGLSAVYSFFDPTLRRRSLGTYMVLWLAERARQLGLGHVYLGYWIDDCPKMSYKARFRPLEVYGPGGWRPFEPAAD